MQFLSGRRRQGLPDFRLEGKWKRDLIHDALSPVAVSKKSLSPAPLLPSSSRACPGCTRAHPPPAQPPQLVLSLALLLARTKTRRRARGSSHSIPLQVGLALRFHACRSRCRGVLAVAISPHLNRIDACKREACGVSLLMRPRSSPQIPYSYISCPTSLSPRVLSCSLHSKFSPVPLAALPSLIASQ